MNALFNIVGSIYEASFVPGQWDSTMEELCRVFNAHSAAIFMDDHEYKIRDMVGSHGFPAGVRIAYRLGLSKYDYTFQLQEQAPPGQALQLVDTRALKQSHPFYYRLLLKPNDIGFLGAMSIYNDVEWHIGIGIHRSFDAEPFSTDDLNKLQLLYPHFKRALRIHKEFIKLQSQQQTLQSALSNLMLGVITLNPDGTVNYCNPVATTLMKQHQGLKITEHNKLQAHFANENQ